MTIDEAAEQNAGRWRAEADEVVASHPGAETFRDAARTTAIGTDVGPEKLACFLGLEPARVLSKYAFEAVTSGTDHARHEAYERPPWGPRRRAVEDRLDAVETAVYGTLDLTPRAGDPTYGPYRLVCEPRDLERPWLVLPHNSAAGYLDEADSFDAGPFDADACRWQERHELATTERGSVAASVSPDAWPHLLADEDTTSVTDHDLIEVVARDGERPWTDVDTVRVSAAYFDPLLKAYQEVFISGRPSQDPAVRLAGLIDARGPLEVVA